LIYVTCRLVLSCLAWIAHHHASLPAPQMLLSSGLSPEQRELADMILESGNTLLTILGDILDFSKIDHNRWGRSPACTAVRGAARWKLARKDQTTLPALPGASALQSNLPKQS
jgi:signal transduction histidine kinase